MLFDVHPAATDAFDKHARSMVRRDRQPASSPPPNRSSPFQPDIHIAAEISDEDIVGDLEEAGIDFFGRTVSRTYRRHGVKYTVEGEEYRDLQRLVESVHRHGSIQKHLSKDFIERTLFDWIARAESDSSFGDAPVQHLLEVSATAVARRTVWVPLANVYVQSPLQIGRANLQPLDSQRFETWANDLREEGVQDEIVSAMFKDLRPKLQGLAAVTVEVEAEPTRSGEIAIEEATEVAALLGILSPALRVLNVACGARVKGCELVRTTTSIIVVGGHITIKQAALDDALPQRIVLSEAELSRFRPTPWDTLLRLVKERSSPFQQSVYDGLMIYSRAAFTADTTEKLLYTLTSLEAALLKSDNEPIQQNLAERLAVLLEPSLVGRKAVIRLVRSVYGLRSRYLHHGRTLADEEQLTEFLAVAWRFWMVALRNIEKFKHREDFVEAIDDHKLT